MAAPVVRGVGAFLGSTTTITPTKHYLTDVGDLLLFFIETVKADTATVAGWTAVPNSPVTDDAVGTKLWVFYAIETSEEVSTLTNDPGNHISGQIMSIQAGTFDPANPFNVSASGFQLATVDVSIPGATTTVPDCLVVAATSADYPDAAEDNVEFSAWANANLTAITEWIDSSTAAAGGGALGVATGVKASAGAYGATTAIAATSSARTSLSLAIAPAVTTTPVGNTLQLIHNTRAVVTESVQLVFAVAVIISTTPVGNTLQLVYDTRASVAESVQLVFAVAGPDLTNVPVVRGVGGFAGSTTTISPLKHYLTAAGDLLIYQIETIKIDVPTVAGWNEAPASPSVGDGGTKLSVFWVIETAGGVSTLSNAPGNHILGQIISIEAGTFDPDNPFNEGGSTTQPADTFVSVPGGTTTVPGCLILALTAADLPDASGTDAEFSAWTNADLVSVHELLDNSGAAGGGGAIGAAYGVKATAGTFGTTTATAATVSARASLMLAIAPFSATTPVGTTLQIIHNTAGRVAQSVQLIFSVEHVLTGFYTDWYADIYAPSASAVGKTLQVVYATAATTAVMRNIGTSLQLVWATNYLALGTVIGRTLTLVYATQPTITLLPIVAALRKIGQFRRSPNRALILVPLKLVQAFGLDEGWEIVSTPFYFNHDQSEQFQAVLGYVWSIYADADAARLMEAIDTELAARGVTFTT